MISLSSLLPEYDEAGKRASKTRLSDGRKIYEADGVEWVKALRARFDVPVLINIQKLDIAWKKDSLEFYFQHGHSDGKTERFKEHLEKYPNSPIVMPEIAITDRHTVAFTNGRHRFSYFRDLGKSHIYISIDKLHGKLCKELFA
jgi:hypothetical protein